MAQRIEHTPFEWAVWNGRIVLFRRVSLKPLWGLCIFVAGYLAVLSVLIGVLIVVLGMPHHAKFSPIWAVPVGVVSLAFIYGFVKVFKAEQGFLLPCRFLRIGAGIQLACQTLCIPQPTAMGGTFAGSPTRWLMVLKPGRAPRRIVRVFSELDLLKINCALASSSSGTASLSR